MNPYQKRMKDALDKMEAIRKKAETEKRVMTAEELTERGTLMAEYKAADAEWKSIQAEEELRGQAYGTEGAGALTTEGDPAHPATAPDAPIYRGSKATALGMQLLDIRTMSRPDTHETGEVRGARSRLEQTEKRNAAMLEAQAKKENRAAATGGFTIGVPSEGGFFLQGETSVELMTNAFNNSEVLSRCSPRTLSGTQFLEVIGIDETSRATGSRGGGVRVYTTAELAAFTQSKTAFRMIRIEPKKLTGLYYASGEMLKNVTFLGQEMRQLFGEEFAFKCQDLAIRGSGAGEALGILNAGCLISVTAEKGQPADTIVSENIKKMFMRLRLASRGKAVWLYNQECEEQLESLTQAIGTGGVLSSLFVPAGTGMNNTPTAKMKGLPAIPIEQASAIGDAGDVILADFSQYIVANKGDINEAMSIHVNFLYDQETYRFIYYFDGQPRWSSAVTPYKGSATVGPFVVTGAR